MFVMSWAQWDTGVIIQQPLIIPKLFRKNNGHKNPGLCCSRLPVQGQEYLSFFFFNPLFLSVFLSYPLTASPSPSLNPINSFRSYQDGIRQKRLYLEAEERSFLQMHFSGLHCRCHTVGRGRAEIGGGCGCLGSEAVSTVFFLLFYSLNTVILLALKSISRYCALNPPRFQHPAAPWLYVHKLD